MNKIKKELWFQDAIFTEDSADFRGNKTIIKIEVEVDKMKFSVTPTFTNNFLNV